MRIKVTKSDVIWNYIGTFLSLGSGFLLLPFVVYFLDSESLGLWYVFLSLGGIVVLFDFGFSPTLARNVAYSWSGAQQLLKKGANIVEGNEPNIKLLKKVLLTCKWIYLIISIIALLILVSLGTIYILYISKGLNKYYVLGSWMIYSISVFFSLYYGYYITFLRGVGAIKDINISTIVSRIVQIFLSIILLYLGLGILAVAIANLSYGLLFRLLAKNSFYRYQQIGIRLSNVENKIVKSDIINTFEIIWHNAWRDGLVSLSKYFTNQATVLILSFFVTLTETGVYSISVQLTTAIATISGALYTSYQPALQSLYINNNMKKSREMMSLAMVVYIVLFWVGFIIFVLIGLPIINIVKPEFIFSIPVFTLVAIYHFLLNYHSYHASFISNTNNVPYVNAFIISSIGGILTAVLLLKITNFGLVGVIFAQILIQALYNNWYWPMYVMKLLDTNIVSMFIIGIERIIDTIKSLALKCKKSV